jgi:hypothetical protein
MACSCSAAVDSISCPQLLSFLLRLRDLGRFSLCAIGNKKQARNAEQQKEEKEAGEVPPGSGLTPNGHASP